MPILRHGIHRPLIRTSFRSLNLSHSIRPLFNSSKPVETRPIRAAFFATAFLVSAGLLTVYYFDARSAFHRYFLNPLLRAALDAEASHKVAVKVLRAGLGPKDPLKDDPQLKCFLWGEELSNPIGLAAGFDKDGEAIDGLFDLGFSWVEIGSVTPKPQLGNPRPRVFRLEEDNAIINRYGFPSQGHFAVLSRLRDRIPDFGPPPTRAALQNNSILAVNLGKNKDSVGDSTEDFVAGIRTFGPYADVLVVNVSSPNTPGLRGLQSRELLEHLLEEVMEARDALPPSTFTSQKPKIVLKIAPDLEESQLREMAVVIRKSDIDGVIVSNTTVQRPETLSSPAKREVGGLSGPPMKPLALKTLRTLRGELPASIHIIGCGGIETGEDALDYARSGASMVQVYTGFAYDGPGACRRIKDEIIEELAKEGKSWQQIVNEAVEKFSWKKEEEETNGDSIVVKLISEAEELRKKLDKLAESVEGRPV